MNLKFILKILLKHLKDHLWNILGKKERIIPYKALLVLTNDCNSRCDFCGIWKINQDNPALREKELDLNNYKDFFKSYGSDLYWLALGGGEVTVKKDILEIIDLAIDLCPNLGLITFTTNGLSPKIAEKIALHIKNHKVSCFVTISLDGDKKIHDKLRGVEGNFEKVKETMALLKNHSIRAYYGITLSDKNNHFINSEYKNYRDDMKAVTFVHSGGIYDQENIQNLDIIKNSLKLIIEKYKISKPSEIIEYLYLRLGYRFLKNKMKKNIIPCSAGYSSVHLSPYGDISPCMFLPESGSVKDKSFREIILSKKNNDLRSRAPKGECKKCWMNCYAPHSILQHPVKSLINSFKG